MKVPDDSSDEPNYVTRCCIALRVLCLAVYCVCVSVIVNTTGYTQFWLENVNGRDHLEIRRGWKGNIELGVMNVC